MRFENYCSLVTLPIMIVWVISVTPPSSPSISASSREIRGRERGACLILIKKKCRGINHALAALIRKKSRVAPAGEEGWPTGRRETERTKGRRPALFAVCLREHVIVYCCESREIVSFEWSGTRDWCDPSGQQRRNIIDVLFSSFLSPSPRPAFFLVRSSTLVARSVNCFPNSDMLEWDYVRRQLQWYISNMRHAASAKPCHPDFIIVSISPVILIGLFSRGAPLNLFACKFVRPFLSRISSRKYRHYPELLRLHGSNFSRRHTSDIW